MLYDMLRSGNPESVPLRKGPLIFAAMSAVPGPVSRTPMASPTGGNMHVYNPYPSPPAEFASLEPSPPSRRNGPVSSVFRGPPQVDLRSHGGPVISPTWNSTELPPLAHKSSKSSLRMAVERTASAVSRGDTGPEHARPRVLTKARPTTPQKPGTSGHKVLAAPGDPLLLDDDPFARAEGVKMLKPRTSSGDCSSASLRASNGDIFSSEDGHAPPVPKAPLTPASSEDALMPENFPPTPVTPDNYKTARQQRRGQWLEKAPPPAVADVVAKQFLDEAQEQPREPTPPPTHFPIMAFMSDANLLPLLLPYLSYSEWLPLYSANKQIRELFQSRILREFVLERYLGTVGYWKWNYEWAEPLALSLKASLTPHLRPCAY
ncbi:hypothetical protein OG21DRAFT_1337324 [Imleria badia]|nr:hypothetical protein OG21DRAFT_1337324 [Imleria badia]